jgi:ATP-binding cassette subfamily B protein
MSLPIYASRGPVRFLLHYVRRRFWSHTVVLLAVVAAVACAIGSQYGVKHLVDALSGGTSNTRDGTDYELWGAVALLLALVAGDNLLWRLAGWVSTGAFVAVGGDLRLDLFNHLSGHGTRYFTDRFPGALASRITTAANTAWTIENAATWNTIPPCLAVFSAIALLAVVDWQMTAVLLVIVLILAGIIGWLAASGHDLHTRFAGQAAAVSGDLTDVVSNMNLVRAFGATRREQERLSGTIAREMSAQRDSLRSLERLRLLHATSVFIISAGVLVWSVELWRQGRITTGDVVLTTTLGFTVLHASRDLAMALVDLVQQFAKLGDAIHVLGSPHEMPDAPNARPLVHHGGAVAFDNVGFAYPDGEVVLSGFDLRIPPGQRIGLVGKSGAGKSTILSLLQRNYDPTAGRILIDQQDIVRVTQESLRQSIAVVQQDISLFHRTVLENLRYGNPDASDDAVYRAADAAHCTGFIAALPQGFDTIVGERGVKLSGGQRQRLAIARAFLRDAPIILLDEATSALDSESERSVKDALERLVANRTVIAVAHRLSTLDSFDRIVVLDHGRIIEDGTPAALLRRDGPYARMYRLQMARSAAE